MWAYLPQHANLTFKGNPISPLFQRVALWWWNITAYLGLYKSLAWSGNELQTAAAYHWFKHNSMELITTSFQLLVRVYTFSYFQALLDINMLSLLWCLGIEFIFIRACISILTVSSPQDNMEFNTKLSTPIKCS